MKSRSLCVTAKASRIKNAQSLFLDTCELNGDYSLDIRLAATQVYKFDPQFFSFSSVH